ncbi:MAG: vWA domain-containing protein [Patescibacteria group bacterium]|mgnify:CR=1 FL=1
MAHKFESEMPLEGVVTAEAKLEDFFARNQDFFALYAGDASIKAKPSRELGTFAIDLEKGVLYGDPSYYEKKGLTEAHAFNSFLHEFEHFRRLMTLTRERRGLEGWRVHRDRMKAKPHLHVFDNVLEDISVDRAILSRAPSQSDTQIDLYRTHLWKDRDFLKLPRHLQFIYGLFREQMLPEEPVEIADEVRAEIDRLRAMKNFAGQSIADVMSNPDLPQAKRLALQERFFEPVYERLFKQDAEEKQKEQQQKQETQKAGQEQAEEGERSEQKNPFKQNQELGHGQSEHGQPSGQEQTGESLNPDDFFKDLYKEFFDKSPDAALTEKQIEEAVKKAVESKGGRPKSAEELAQEAYAKEAGVSIEDLKAYQWFWETVENIRSPEKDETVVEQIRTVFRQIVTERLESVSRPKQPVEEGEYLIRPAEAVAEIQSGRTEPRVWMTHEVKERQRELFGAFDVTLVCDRSGSMKESSGGAVKKHEQRKAVALLLEALREFCDDLDDARKDLTADLRVRSEVWSFGGPSEVGCIKALSEELTDKQRVAVFKELENTPGVSTRDDLALVGLAASIPEEDIERIVRGELRKVVIVLTDGYSSNPHGAKKAIKDLRDKGVMVAAIGITSAANAAIELYKPDGRLAEHAAMTGVRVGEALESFIKELNGSH